MSLHLRIQAWGMHWATAIKFVHLPAIYTVWCARAHRSMQLLQRKTLDFIVSVHGHQTARTWRTQTQTATDWSLERTAAEHCRHCCQRVEKAFTTLFSRTWTTFWSLNIYYRLCTVWGNSVFCGLNVLTDVTMFDWPKWNNRMSGKLKKSTLLFHLVPPKCKLRDSL